MSFEDFTITKREILVSIAITLFFIGIGFLISGAIENKINENNEKYFKALKINNNEEMFRYAIKTNVGYTLAEGKVKVENGVSIEEIEGEYLKIKKVTEKYTKHKRQVAHTRKVGKRTETYYTTEEYWTWDFAGQEEIHVDSFNFLGVDFEYNTIKFQNEIYKETKSEGYHIRYKYYVIPSEFQGTLFTYINKNNINENTFFENKTIENIIKEKENELNTNKGIFWFIWIILIVLINFVYVSLENQYLEDR